MKPKVLVIGLDGATFDLIEPWATAGHLPTLSRLMQRGTWSRFLSTPNMHSASAWTSILTGLNPGRHGLYVFQDRDFTTGRQVFFKGGDRTGELITAHLARHGWTSGLVNVPMTYPAECPGSGFAISGLDAPALTENAFCPRDLFTEIFSRFPSYSFSPRGLGDLMRAGRVLDAINAWKTLTEVQTSTIEYLLEKRPVDFFMTVFTASDWGGHNLWKYSDGDSEIGNALLAVYQFLDQAVARLLAHAGEETQVYVLSDHGMGPHTGASYHLAEWLQQHGFMVRTEGSKARPTLIEATRRVARDVLPVSVREKIKSTLGGERVKRLQSTEKDAFYSSVDWGATTAYTEPGRHIININLAGRNEQGNVPADDYDQLRNRLITELSGWLDANGQRVVERITKREEVYAGPYASTASDLYVHWNPAASLGDPPAEVKARGFWWSGDHRPEGILISDGPGIRQARGKRVPIVYDLVPTILYLAGLPIPGGLDGRVIEEVCTPEFQAAHPIRQEEATGTLDGADTNLLSQEDEKLIEEKLRGLGYM